MEIFLHVGLGKTGSTYLQKQLFPRLEHKVSLISGNHSILDIILTAQKKKVDGNEFTLEKRAVARWRSSLRKPTIISHEFLLGHQSNGYSDIKARSEVLLDLFPDSNILIAIRNQSDILKSGWSQGLKKGSGYSFREYINGDIQSVVDQPIESYRQMTNLFCYDFSTMFGWCLDDELEVKPRIFFLPFEAEKSSLTSEYTWRNIISNWLDNKVSVGAIEDKSDVNSSPAFKSQCAQFILNRIAFHMKWKANHWHYMRAETDKPLQKIFIQIYKSFMKRSLDKSWVSILINNVGFSIFYSLYFDEYQFYKKFDLPSSLKIKNREFLEDIKIFDLSIQSRYTKISLDQSMT